MIKEFEIALTILDEIIDEKQSFQEALRKKFVAEVDLRPMRANVAGLVGCALRHNIYFDFMMKDFAGYENRDRRLLTLCLSNAFFFRRFNDEEVLAMCKEELGEEKLALAAPLFELASTPEKYIPESVDRHSNTFLSLRFNIPEWTVKIIAHFGTTNLYQTLRKFSRPASVYLRVRTSKLALAPLLENPDFAAAEIQGIVNYKGKVSLRKNQDYVKGLLFNEKPLTKKLIDEHLVADPDQVLLYNGNADCSLEKELIETYGAKVGLNIAVPEVDEKVEVSKMIRDLGLKNVNFFSAPDPSSMMASISTNQKLVIAAPNSTNFDLIPTAPDYLLHYDTEKMDGILAQEKAVLEGAAKYVDEGGTLLYIVYTVSRKEGRHMITDFLKSHPEFRLVSDQQHFPFEELETAAYVAELVKGEKQLAIPPAFSDLAAASAPSSIASASSAK